VARFLFRKGAIEVISYLRKVGKAGYYEMLKQGFVVSRGTFSNLMKKLGEENILARRIIDSHPPRVEYRLTDKGKEVAEMLNKLDKTLQRK